MAFKIELSGQFRVGIINVDSNLTILTILQNAFGCVFSVFVVLGIIGFISALDLNIQHQDESLHQDEMVLIWKSHFESKTPTSSKQSKNQICCSGYLARQGMSYVVCCASATVETGSGGAHLVNSEKTA